MMRPERGFTLIEVVVALSLSAIVVLLAHRVLTGIVDGSKQVVDARAALDREMNARRWLSEAFGSLEIGTLAGPRSFAGRAGQVEFTTAQRVTTGWLEPSRVMLARRSDSLVASFDAGGVIVLATGVSEVAFDYLLDPGADARWVREWVSPVSAPLMVRMRIAAQAGATDTLLFLVGPRG